MSNSSRDHNYYDETAKTCTLTYNFSGAEDPFTGEITQTVGQVFRSINGQYVDTINVDDMDSIRATADEKHVLATIEGKEYIIGLNK